MSSQIMDKFQLKKKEKQRGTKEDQVKILKTELNFNAVQGTKATHVRACDKNESAVNL